MKNILLIPGQGSQFVGMINQFQKYQYSKDILDRVDSFLGYSVFQNNDIRSRSLTKPHRTCPTSHYNLMLRKKHLASMNSTSKSIRVSLIHYSFILGHSLGEYTASVLGEFLTLEQGVKITSIRGKPMQDSIKSLSIRMSQVFVSEHLVKQCLSQVQQEGVCQITRINHDNHLVLTGTKEVVDFITKYQEEKHKLKVK